MGSVPVWAVLIAFLAAAPGYLAWYRTRSTDAHTRQRLDRDQAIDGFESLIDELRKELDRRTAAFEADLRRAEEHCARRVARLRWEFTHRTAEIAEAHNALDEKASGGEHQVEGG